MSYLEYAHLPSGRRSRLAALTDRAHGRIALLTLDPATLTHPSSPSPGDEADPHHAFRLAAEAGFSAITTPIGLAETYHPDYAELLPLVLDLNPPSAPGQPPLLTASIEDALRLDAHAVAFTLDQRDAAHEPNLTQFQHVRSEAHRYGLPVVLRTRPARDSDPHRASDHAVAAACAAASLAADLVELALPSYSYAPAQDANTPLLDALRAACATPILLNLDASADPTQAAHHARAALDAGCAGITASHTLLQRDYRDALHLAAQLRDQLAA